MSTVRSFREKMKIFHSYALSVEGEMIYLTAFWGLTDTWLFVGNLRENVREILSVLILDVEIAFWR